MASTFTPNVQFEEPARGDQVGTWDTPVNNNQTLADLIVGGITTISLNNSPVVLAAAQFQCKTITFNSTLTGSVVITFPSSFKKSYEIFNNCTGIGSFTITLATTAAGGQAICCPPGEFIDCINDGTNIKFKNFGRVGSYWDYAGSSVPNWVSGCTVPPYLNCDGSAVSSAIYPVLSAIYGSVLPDSRGRSRFTLNQGTARVTSGISGVNGNLVAQSGGSESLTAHTHVNTLTDPGHTHATGPVTAYLGTVATSFSAGGTTGITTPFTANLFNTGSAFTGMSINNAAAGAGGSQNMPPAFIGGLCLIRAA